MQKSFTSREGRGRRRRVAVLFGVAAIEVSAAAGILRQSEEPRSIVGETSVETTAISQMPGPETSTETSGETVRITFGTLASTGTESSATAPETQATETTPAQPVECTSTRHGNREKAQIAFTFDDAGENLAKILSVLDSKGIKGTFFLLAGELEAHPDQWREAVANGHLVLNHTVHHNTDLASRSAEKMKEEIVGWEDTAREVLGDDYVDRMKADFPYFRTPGGGESERLRTVLGELGYTKIIFWSVEDVYFSSHNPDNIAMNDHYVKDAENGAIFLLHPGDWEYVSDIVDRLTEKGYSFVTVDEVLQ